MRFRNNNQSTESVTLNKTSFVNKTQKDLKWQDIQNSKAMRRGGSVGDSDFYDKEYL